MRIRSIVVCAILFGGFSGIAGAAPQNFLFADSDELTSLANLIRRPDIAGVQVVYSWKSLETAIDEYDFTRVERDLAYLQGLNRKLFVQLQDRFFEVQHRNVPRYLLDDPVYGGGLVPQADNPGENWPAGHGWVAQQWNPAVRARYQKLLQALAQRFDGRVYGINLPESAIDIDKDAERANGGFTCDKYFEAELENLKFAKQVFRNPFSVSELRAGSAMVSSRARHRRSPPSPARMRAA